MTVESEDFIIREDGVSIELQWSNHDYIDNPHISFNVSTTPAVQPILIFDSMTSAILTVAYNTFYTVSVVATVSDAVCDRVRMSLIPLHYSELDIAHCSHNIYCVTSE